MMPHAATQAPCVPAKAAPAPDMTMPMLCDLWLAAKAQETAAIGRRREIETQIADAIPHPPEGTVKAVFGALTVKVTGKMTRALDPERLATLDAQIPAAILNRVIEYKPVLNLREFRYVQDHEPDYFRALAGAVTTKPAKPTIDITIKEI